MAVFILPEVLLQFYKPHLDYLTTHATDPDMRRYIMAEEACRHYIDLDHYEATVPIDTVPRYWKDAVKKYGEDSLLAYGIVPWHIGLMKFKLTEAFKNKNVSLILKLSADIGHYIADAHVPLHATENYNGQLTGQHGIHGLWESRLPELFSERYDFFTGQARYIDNVQELAWQASESSYAAKDSVLHLERTLHARFDPAYKYTFEMRGQSLVKTYSRAYAEAYHQLLGNQVERRLKASVYAVGCIWYTAWVDAGQPDMLVAPVTIPPDTLLPSTIMNKQMIGRQE